MRKDDYDRLRELARLEYERNLEAIDRVYGILNKVSSGSKKATAAIKELLSDGVTVKPKKKRVAKKRIRSRRGAIRQLVKQIAKKQKDIFTINDVIQAVKEKRHRFDEKKQRNTVYVSLQILEKEGLIKCVEKGGGKKPSKYILTKNR